MHRAEDLRFHRGCCRLSDRRQGAQTVEYHCIRDELRVWSQHLYNEQVQSLQPWKQRVGTAIIIIIIVVVFEALLITRIVIQARFITGNIIKRRDEGGEWTRSDETTQEQLESQEQEGSQCGSHS